MKKTIYATNRPNSFIAKSGSAPSPAGDELSAANANRDRKRKLAEATEKGQRWVRFVLRKRNVETMDAVARLASFCGQPGPRHGWLLSPALPPGSAEVAEASE